MKVWTITLCHNDPEIISDSLRQYYATKSPKVETIHVLVDQHWPINKIACKRSLESLARDYKCVLLDPGRNLGLHDGFNWAMNQFAIPDNAGIIGYDPDSWPIQSGWDEAMCKAFMGDPTINWISLWHQHAYSQLIAEGAAYANIETINGIELQTLKRAVMNSVCMFRAGWLKSVGGLYEGNKYYGGLEVAMWEKIKPGRWVFLPGFLEDLRLHDRVHPWYREYKWRHAHLRDFTGTFEEYVTLRESTDPSQPSTV
jgi:hypothetical protein